MFWSKYKNIKLTYISTKQECDKSGYDTVIIVNVDGIYKGRFLCETIEINPQNMLGVSLSNRLGSWFDKCAQLRYARLAKCKIDKNSRVAVKYAIKIIKEKWEDDIYHNKYEELKSQLNCNNQCTKVCK